MARICSILIFLRKSISLLWNDSMTLLLLFILSFPSEISCLLKRLNQRKFVLGEEVMVGNITKRIKQSDYIRIRTLF